jgi:hypothetical protein
MNRANRLRPPLDRPPAMRAAVIAGAARPITPAPGGVGPMTTAGAARPDRRRDRTSAGIV